MPGISECWSIDQSPALSCSSSSGSPSVKTDREIDSSWCSRRRLSCPVHNQNLFIRNLLPLETSNTLDYISLWCATPYRLDGHIARTHTSPCARTRERERALTHTRSVTNPPRASKFVRWLSARPWGCWEEEEGGTVWEVTMHYSLGDSMPMQSSANKYPAP